MGWVDYRFVFLINSYLFGFLGSYLCHDLSLQCMEGSKVHGLTSSKAYGILVP